MKKTIFITAMMLFGIFGFSKAGMARTHTGVSHGAISMSEIAAPVAAPLEDCTVTVKGWLGTAYLDVTFTVRGVSCVQLLKSLK